MLQTPNKKSNSIRSKPVCSVVTNFNLIQKENSMSQSKEQLDIDKDIEERVTKLLDDFEEFYKEFPSEAVINSTHDKAAIVFLFAKIAGLQLCVEKFVEDVYK